MNRRMRRANRRGKQSAPPPEQIAAGQDFTGNFIEYGRRLLNEGRDQEAMEVAKRAILIDETDASKAFFVQCVRGWSYFPGAEELRGVLARALTERWATPRDLGSLPLELLRRDPVIAQATERVSADWPRRLAMSDIFGARGLAAVSNNFLLLAVLTSGKITDINLERLLTSMRASLLEFYCRDESNADEEVLRFCCALAQQCFFNEYVFDITPNEDNNVALLRRRIVDRTSADEKISAIRLALFACYERLESLASASLLEQRWPATIEALFDQQVREPLAYQRLRDSIPQMTPITNTTSVEVKAQYEDDPYPRWIWLPAKTQTLTFDESIRQGFPFSDYRPIEKKNVDTLIAGCGTGQHSILFAQDFPDAKILAVDLSRQSLAYAKQKTQAMKISNIEYAQADILELHRIGRRFDVISSTGVLHHLHDPEDGWRKLLALLRPKGCMHIGLYSEAARTCISAAREWLRAHGYTASTDNIRRARQALADLARSEPSFKNVLEFGDFYSTSGCRDLLFHVQESNFTIPRIQTFLSQNNLQFLGFVIGGAPRNMFARNFSREQESNLELWQKVETENPNTFRGMYEFWVQKIEQV